MDRQRPSTKNTAKSNDSLSPPPASGQLVPSNRGELEQTSPTQNFAPLVYAQDEFALTACNHALVEWMSAKIPLLSVDLYHSPAMEQLIRNYMESFSLSEQWAQSTNHFVERLAESTVHVRGATPVDPETLVRAFGKHVRSGLETRATLKPTLVSADLASKPVNTVLQRLRADLSERVSSIAEHFCEVIRQGVLRNFIGRVTWLNSRTCRLTHPTWPVFYERTEVMRAGVFKGQAKPVFGQRFGQAEHHLMNATVSPGLPSRSDMPERLHPLLDALPPMAIALFCTIDGLLIRERIVERDIGDAATSEQAGPVDDPAIVLGPFVITAWTDREVRPADASNRLRTAS